MGFLDEAVIHVVSGDGGKGCISFRRARFIPKGGPDGGDGGKGGDVIIRASNKLHTLYDFGSRRRFKAQNGGSGKGSNQTGKNGEDVIIEVPLGTIISDHQTGEMFGDLIQNEQEITVALGGIGGKGNRHFATSTNRSPRFAQSGIPGESKKLKLTLKQLADVGLIGLPNAGKSTLLSSLTMARPKIDAYPFTTIVPNLGILDIDGRENLTIADIPGLIEGASEGKGLGHRFLRHIERTKFLLHVIDISQAPADDPLRDYYILEEELKKYDISLLMKKRMIIANKIDLERVDGLKPENIISRINKTGYETISVSALTGKGINELKVFLSKSID
ncbi:MAG: GTPase ObgE [Deltaproteobacteria bacterium]|nr:GTPase ObgE [Deltaproteobacteria bacterium]